MSLDPFSGLDAPAATLRKSVKYTYRSPENQVSPTLFPSGVATSQLLDNAPTASSTYYVIDGATGQRRQVTYEQFIAKKGGF